MIEALYKQYHASVFRVCLRYTGRSDDAEDLVQDVFMKVRDNLDRFRGESAPFTWIYRIAVNESLQFLRKHRREERCDDEWIANALSTESFERHSNNRLFLKELFRGVDVKVRETILMLYYEGMKQEEVAEVLQVSRRMVNKRIDKFREFMRKKGYEVKKGGDHGQE